MRGAAVGVEGWTESEPPPPETHPPTTALVPHPPGSYLSPEQIVPENGLVLREQD